MIIKKIENSGIKYLLIFIVINFINEYWSIEVGRPTLNHLFIFFILLKLPFIYYYNEKVKLVLVSIVIYLIVILVNSIVTLGKYGFDFSFISIILKLFVFIVLVPYFVSVTSNDLNLFFKYLHVSLLLFVFLPGMIEYITQKNIMDFGSGLSSSLFYMRAFTIDKVDFGFNLTLLIGTSIILYRRNNVLLKIIQVLIIVASLFFLVLSYSSTSIVGLSISVLIYILFYSKRKFWNIIIITLLFSSILIATSEFQDAYLYKYSTIEAGYGEDEFRSVAFFQSLELFVESPIFGYGAESNGFLMMERISWLGGPLSSHNIITEFINFGLIGAMMILFPFVFIGMNVFRLRRFKSDSMFFFILISGPLIARFLFYFHRFDKSIYILWLSIGVILMFNYKNLYVSHRYISKSNR